ncbi:tryptophan synthase subunit alpha [Candidatus Bathyarchaeota archaeon]|jgi:tryptophan synthase alpha chain|nr:tryptophan synthase subunit alpha [Candidatus Bathyarchaeota archaeon]
MIISESFRELHRRGEGALIGYITGGDPSPKISQKIVETIAKEGVDIIEIGIPFSDPIADGPTIQAASNRSLNAGTTPQAIFDIVKETKSRIEIPIALMTYYNVLFKMGVQNFLTKASKHRVDGLIIPDLPIEEAAEYRELAEKQGIDTIFLATPSTLPNRLKDILDYTSGFLYLISIHGVTGKREDVSQLTIQSIKRIKPYTAGTIPLAVGFGLYKPEHISSVIGSGADGAIVGSALVKIVESNLNDSIKLIEQISTLTRNLKSVTLLKK